MMCDCGSGELFFLVFLVCVIMCLVVFWVMKKVLCVLVLNMKLKLLGEMFIMCCVVDIFELLIRMLMVFVFVLVCVMVVWMLFGFVMFRCMMCVLLFFDLMLVCSFFRCLIWCEVSMIFVLVVVSVCVKCVLRLFDVFVISVILFFRLIDKFMMCVFCVLV